MYKLNPEGKKRGRVRLVIFMVVRKSRHNKKSTQAAHLQSYGAGPLEKQSHEEPLASGAPSLACLERKVTGLSLAEGVIAFLLPP